MKTDFFSHGGDLSLIATASSLPLAKVLDFSASINPLGMPLGARQAIVGALDQLAHYPHPQAQELAHCVAVTYALQPRQVLVANGSTELIYLITRALAPKRALICAPAFAEYERAARLAGARIKFLRLRKKTAFRIDPAKFSAALAGCDLAFLCNPNNPTGHALERQALREIADAARQANCVLVLDEAFADFCPEFALLGHYQNSHLLILRSLTKFYGLPGLRIGFLAGPARLLAKIKTHKEPWSVNALAIKAACAALADADFRRRSSQFMALTRPWLAEELVRVAGGLIYPAAANYLFWENPKAPLIVAGLLRQGIALRSCANFRGLGNQFLRVAIRGQVENQRLLAALHGYLTGN